MIISRIISGGQTGVDEAALRAARARGVPTGGTMPRGFKTLAGPRPEFRELYGMVEHASDKYPPRTRANVEASDVTVRIAWNLRTLGELATALACRQADKPMFDITLRRYALGYDLMTSHELPRAVDGLRDLAAKLGRPIVVNFAGNSEQTAHGIGAFAEQVVGRILDRLKEMS